MQRTFLAAKLALCLSLLAAPALPATYAVGDQGEYEAIPPPGWNGSARLPVLLFLHGAWSGPDQVTDDPETMAALGHAGVLLIAPVGTRKSWAVPNAPTSGPRDEVQFLDAALADAGRRFPIDPARTRVAGFSIGAAMAATYACHRGQTVAAVLTIAGTFWRPLPETCPAGPLPWMHIHGESDTTWPLAGRAIRDTWRQGDIESGLGMLAARFACAAPAAAPPIEDARCVERPGCTGGTAMRICLHPGGHDIRAAWFEAFLRWSDAVPSSAPAR